MDGVLKEALVQCGPLKLGVWIDDPPHDVLKPAYIDAIHALPFHELAVMVDGPKPGIKDARWSAAQLKEFFAAFPAHDRIMTVWTPAQKHPIAELEAKIMELADALKPIAIEADAEPAGKWAKKFLVGYATLGEAAADTMRVLRKPGVRTEVTVFPSAYSSAAELVKLADVLVSQNYAVASHDGQAVPAFGPLGPDRYPRESILLARERFPKQRIVSGHAAYHQRFTNLPPHDAMMKAIASATGVGCNHIRFWAGKHFFRFKHAYALEVIDEIRPFVVL